MYDLSDVDEVANTFLRMEVATNITAVRADYARLVEFYPELMTVLYSIADEVYKDFSISRRNASKNRHKDGLPQALGDLLYSVTTGTPLVPKDLTQYDIAVRIILDFVSSGKIQTIAGVAWTAAAIPDLLSLENLVNNYVILPDFILRKDITVQDLKSPSELAEIKFPARLFSTENKGKGRLCYYIREQDTIKSNIPYTAVRDFLSRNIKVPTIGIIGYVSRHKGVTTYQPICSSIYTGAVKHLYQGKYQSDPSLSFDIKTLFRRIKSPSPNLVLKIPKLKELSCQEDFHESIRGWTKRRVQVVVSPHVGTVALKISRKAFKVKIVDFLLDEQYNPKGVKIMFEHEVFDVRCKVPDDVIQEGIADRYMEVYIEKYHDTNLRATLSRFMDSKYHSCSCCGGPTPNDFCRSCHGEMSKVVHGTLEPVLVFQRDDLYSNFNLKIRDYHVQGEGNKVTFTRKTENFVGQRGLPLYPADFGLQILG